MPHNRLLDTRIEKFLLVRTNLPIILVGTFVSALALFFFLEKELPLDTRVKWLSYIALCTVIRAVFLRYWHVNETTRKNVNQRIAVAAVLAFMMSSAFGYYAYIGVTESNLFCSLLILMVLSGMIAGSSGTTAFLFPVFIVFVTPLILPMSVKMFGFEQEIYQTVSVLAIVLLAVCTASAKVVNDSVTSSIITRFDNEELLENLQTEKDRVEKALEREAHANQAKSKFLAVASHDLRQPMHSLRLFTATLALQTRDTRHKTLVSQIDTSVKSLEELFNALLDISKLDAGTLTADKNHVELYGLFLQLQSEFTPLAAEKDLEFVCELQECVVYTDIVLLDRLIRNLINNAIRYTPSGTVTVYTELQKDCLLISVMDTGPGISTENQFRVFDEFVQLKDDSLASDKGLGLGLSIVKRLSVLLDIPILLTSQPDSGSIFSVKVPYGLPGKCHSVDKRVNCENDNIESCFVLIIDDEKTVCQAVEGLLETWGCVVMTAISGETAVRQLEEIGEIPDVIISDYQLRYNETGGSAIQRVRNYLNKEIPAIILTGDIAPERLLEIKQMGFPMLHKPCDPDALKMLLTQQTKAFCNEAVQGQLFT